MWLASWHGCDLSSRSPGVFTVQNNRFFIIFLQTINKVMHPSILIISMWLVAILTILLFAGSLLFCFRSYNPPYMRTLPIYCFVNVAVEIIAKLLPATRTTDYAIFTGFELLYFSYFLTRVIKSRNVRKLIWVLDAVYFIAFGPKAFAHGEVYWLTICECLILVIPCLVFYVEALARTYIVDLPRDPSFWIVTGLFFYISLLPPTLVASGYFGSMNSLKVAMAFYSINNYGQAITYALFVKAMVCRKTKLS